MDAFSIRQAGAGDAEGILECLALAFAAYRDRYTAEAFADTVLSRETIQQRLTDMSLLVAVSPGGEILGRSGVIREFFGMPLIEYVKTLNAAMSRPDRPVEVRHATVGDVESLARLRHALWPDGSEAEHRQDLERFLTGGGNRGAVLVAEAQSSLLGFAEVSIRAYAEGCRTDRVAFLEGWFVGPEARQQGIGRQIVAAAEEWARAQGCVEFASDAEEENEESAAAHRALGFAEVGLIRCFRKDL